MVIVSVAVAVVVALEALITTGNVPPVVGMPEMTPLPVLTVRPGGSPVALKLVGKFDARMLYVNGCPTVPVAVGSLVMPGGPTPTVMTRVCVPVPLALVAPSATLNAPTAPGMPEITPVAALIARPMGNPVAVKLVGLLVPVTWKVKGTPVCAEAVAALVMTGGPVTTVITSVWIPVPVALVALIVMLKVPVPVGAPEMTPVVVLTESPAGNPVALKLVGLLLAVIW